MTALVQLQHPSRGRAVARVDGDRLRLLKAATTYALVEEALALSTPLIGLAGRRDSEEELDYDAIHAGQSAWKLLPPLDHPSEPARCLVTGTGLTHRASADSRQAMHAVQPTATDSMRMYQWGVEGGRPAAGTIGVAPEWFYKGNGLVLRAHNEQLEVPAFAGDGGEESEIAGVYFIDPDGGPRRVGMAQGNEFSDHVFEKKNYLYLAASKLRQCSIGPELILDPDFAGVSGKARILRGAGVLWEKEIRSGEASMCHSLENIEHHHFKFPGHRRPGDVHIHFFGASAFSFGDQIRLEDGDVMEVCFAGFGRPLRNPVHLCSRTPVLTRVATL